MGWHQCDKECGFILFLDNANSERNTGHILTPPVENLSDAETENWLFQQDSAATHTATNTVAALHNTL